MNTWRVILATMVIFGAGVVTGGLLVHHEQIRLPRPQRIPTSARPVPMSPGVMRLEFLRRAQRELDLQPDQRERVDKIIKDSQDRTRRLIQPVAPQLDEEARRARQEFLAVLTPEQRGRFEELLRQQQRPHEQHRPTTPRTERGPVLGTPTNTP